MGACSCGQQFYSPAEAAEHLGVCPSRVRAILVRCPSRLRACRIGQGWAIPRYGIEHFRANPTGVHLVDVEQMPPVATCPQCGGRLYAPPEVAGLLQVSTKRVQAILRRRPARLRAFQVGRRWVVPAVDLDNFKAQRSKIVEAQTLLQALTGGRSFWTTQELAAEAERQGRPVSVRRLQKLCQTRELTAQRPARDYAIPERAARRWLLTWIGEG